METPASSSVTAPRPKLYLAVFFGLLLSAFGAIWVFSAVGRNGYMDQDYGQWTAKMEMIQQCRVGDLAIIGDSQASADLIPALLRPNDVKNFGLTGATPIESYYELQRILACPKPPRAILITFAPRQFQEVNWFWQHAARYGFLSFAEMEEVRHAEAELGPPYLYKGAFGTEPPGAIKNWLYVKSFPTFNFASMVAAAGIGRRHANQMVHDQTLATDGHHLEGNAACAQVPGWDASQDDFQLNPLVKIYFDRLIGLAKSRGVQIFLLSPPVSQLTAKGLTEGYRTGYAKFLAQTARAHPEVNRIGSSFLTMDNCSFGDQHHLNQSGSEAFTRAVAPLLNRVMGSADLAAADGRVPER